MHGRLGQDSLQRVVHLRREEVDLGLLQQLAVGVRQVHFKARLAPGPARSVGT